MGPGLNLDDADLSPKNPALHAKFPQANRPMPIRSRQPTPPRSGPSRNMFSPSSTPAHSPPIVVSQDEEKEEEDEKSAQEETRPRLRAFSDDFSIMSLDDTFETVRIPTAENKHNAQEPLSDRRQHLFGFSLPRWWTSRPSKTEVSSWIVKYAPCFWCTRANRITMTTRDIVLRLCSLCAICGLAQVASASFLLIVLLSKTIVNRVAEYDYADRGRGDAKTVNLWNINAMVFLSGILGIFVVTVMIYARRAIAEVNFGASLRFMWFLFWLIPLEIFVTINLFDYHQVSMIWIKHWWNFESFAWFRKLWCADGTYNTLCVVPIDGLPYFDTQDEWCEFYYNTNACASIKSSAQSIMKAYSYSYYNINGGVALFLVVVLSLAFSLVEGMITKPVVQKNRESHIAGWLFLPIVACFVTGSILFVQSSSIMRFDAEARFWPAMVTLSAGLLYSIAAVLGYLISSLPILNSRDKRGKLCAVTLFIGLMILAFVSMGAILVYSVTLSVNAVSIDLSDDERGQIACLLGGGSCSFCGNDTGQDQCPEWTNDDILRIFRSQMTSVATVAAILMAYSVGPLRFGFVLRRHISTYEIDYV